MSYHLGDDDGSLQDSHGTEPFWSGRSVQLLGPFSIYIGHKVHIKYIRTYLGVVFDRQSSKEAMLLYLLDYYFGEGKALFGARGRYYCIYNQPRCTLCIMGMY
jgi:hypothetical protein